MANLANWSLKEWHDFFKWFSFSNRLAIERNWQEKKDDFISDINDGDYINDDNFWNYLDGLITSAGAENAVNRDYNSAEALANREFQASEAQKQRDWYTELSNSAYQRSVADLKAAGLNPILAAGSLSPAASSAASIPSGSSGSYQVGAGDTVTSIVNSLANVMSASGNLLTGIGNNNKGRAALISSLFKIVGKAIAVGG